MLFDVVSLQRTCSDTVIPTTLLLAAPLKKPRLKTMIEKATELNMHAFIPLITQNTNNTVDSSGLITCMIQATEQSERMSPPLLHSPIHLASDFVTNDDCILLPQIASHPMYYYLICCARADNADSNAVSLPTALHCIRNDPAVSNMPLAVMVGPEGGFTDHELSQFSGKRNVTFVSLGHNVLRSETASLVSLGLIHMLERNCLNLH